MNDRYTFQGGSENRSKEVAFEVLPEGDYNFVIVNAQEPYYKPDTERWVMRTLLRIESKGVEVFYTPSTAAGGVDRDGVKRDAIGDLFIAVNRAPLHEGEEVEVGRLMGARGRCRLKKEIWQNTERNAVARIYVPKQVGPATEQPPRDYSSAEVQKAQAEQVKRSLSPKDPDLDVEPDDIPF